MTELVLDNPFWRFSLATYSTPEISAECLALQESFGINVNLLLFCAWLGTEHQIRLTQTELDAVSEKVRDWQEHVIGPLRSARRALKTIDRQPAAPRKSEECRARGRANRTSDALRSFPPTLAQTCLETSGQCVSENLRQLISRQGTSVGYER